MAYEVTPINEGPPPRFTAILWGEAGNGKTVFAATAPGKKLWLLFDPDGDTSIRSVPDIIKMDLTTAPLSVCNEFDKPNPFGLKELIAEHKISTIVVDSITKCSETALKYIIPQTYKATPTNPTPAGYGARNILIVNFMGRLLVLTKELGVNVIFITHEGAPDKNTEGQILSVNMLLGGQLPNLLSKEISEVWHMSDLNGKRRIAIRPERLRAPMKTRMFDISGSETGFEWKYNPKTRTGHRIDGWWKQFEDNKYDSIPIPK